MGEVHATRTTSDGVAIDHPARIRGVHLVSSGTAGLIELRDGGSGGEVKLAVDTPAVAEGDTVTVPGYIEFTENVHVTITNVDGITLFW